MQFLWRFAPGYVTQTALLADSASLITGWTGAAGAVRWSVASANLVKPYSQTTPGLDGLTGMLGYAQVSPWTFNVQTAAMFKLLHTTKMAGQQSTKCTIYTYDQEAEAWKTFQAIATLDDYSEENLTPWQNIGFQGVRVSFTRCVLNVS